MNHDQSYREKDKSYSEYKTGIVIDQSIDETAFQQGNFEFIADFHIDVFAIDRLKINEGKTFDISPAQDPSQGLNQGLNQNSNLGQVDFQDPSQAPNQGPIQDPTQVPNQSLNQGSDLDHCKARNENKVSKKVCWKGVLTGMIIIAIGEYSKFKAEIEFPIIHQDSFRVTSQISNLNLSLDIFVNSAETNGIFIDSPKTRNLTPKSNLQIQDSGTKIVRLGNSKNAASVFLTVNLKLKINLNCCVPATADYSKYPFKKSKGSNDNDFVYPPAVDESLQSSPRPQNRHRTRRYLTKPDTSGNRHRARIIKVVKEYKDEVINKIQMENGPTAKAYAVNLALYTERNGLLEDDGWKRFRLTAIQQMHRD